MSGRLALSRSLVLRIVVDGLSPRRDDREAGATGRWVDGLYRDQGEAIGGGPAGPRDGRRSSWTWPAWLPPETYRRPVDGPQAERWTRPASETPSSRGRRRSCSRDERWLWPRFRPARSAPGSPPNRPRVSRPFRAGRGGWSSPRSRASTGCRGCRPARRSSRSRARRCPCARRRCGSPRHARSRWSGWPVSEAHTAPASGPFPHPRRRQARKSTGRAVIPSS